MESLGPLPLLPQECELTRARSERLPLCQFSACLIAQAAGVQLLSWEGMCSRNFRGDMFPKCRKGFQMPQDKTMIAALVTARVPWFLGELVFRSKPTQRKVEL